MPLVKMDQLLKRAKENRVGCGAFNVGNMEMVMGAIAAAEELKTPIIIQVTEGRLGQSPLGLIGPMMVQAAKEAKVDIAVHFDHGKTLKNIEKALEYGFTSVMFDGSHLPLEENIRGTNEVIKIASKYGACVEGELGVVGGREDTEDSRESQYTDPKEAEIFYDKTGVDALAISIGNAHGKYRVAPKLEFSVIKEVSDLLDVPLVLHGGSGISDADFQEAIRCGMTKINVGTASFQALANAAKSYVQGETEPDFTTLSEQMMEGTYQNIKRHITVFTYT